ncbi:GNAT family N-acetyltransferase [Alkaliphilus sp. B6464]|uniref:GNAT family N-acetyltransferase n=1 Tax=Alkaliphilus sp. B6464 TaxID=2731219 RepID=UPI001BAC13DF|nr:GNAT family N-acetyltransferase [Alkaliphilus sp. B6464]QUH20379.1 GNAT family N-acetyltransferase [Alkaliphilus sp. B6464]
MGYSLRPITVDDKNFIYDVKKSSNYEYINRIWGWDEDYQRRDFDSDFNDNFNDFCIICVNGSDVGFLQTNTTINSVNITEIHIIPTFQGKRIGKNILQDIISKALSEDKTITIGCFKENEGGKRLYLQLGFSIIKTTATHYEFQYIEK